VVVVVVVVFVVVVFVGDASLHVATTYIVLRVACCHCCHLPLLLLPAFLLPCD